MHPRRGRLCCMPKLIKLSSTQSQNLRESSFTVRAAKLFNSLPIKLRNCTGTSVATFKRMLDSYLRLVPDEPSVPQYVALRAAGANTLNEQIAFMAISSGGGGAPAWP